MTIREATDSDIPSIVALLKLSLGESLMPKSEAFWRWKHVDNPFGKSPVLLAFDGEELIGVRAFMRWEWTYQNQIIKSVRAVDTAVHPGYHGQGIFTKLTMALVEQCKGEGVQFIFNTPNKKSLPGYLKMGWNRQGRMNASVYGLITSFRKRIMQHHHLYTWNSVTDLIVEKENILVTNKNEEFLHWRYGKSPNAQYYYDSSSSGSFIYRIKSGKLKEMRIVEFVGNENKLIQMRETIKQHACSHRAHLITWSGLDVPLLSMPLPIGPIITINQLSGDKSLPLKHWLPTLGDMEVF